MDCIHVFVCLWELNISRFKKKYEGTFIMGAIVLLN